MSWDLYVLPLAAGDDPRDVLDRLEPGSYAGVSVPDIDLGGQRDSVATRLTSLVSAVVEQTGWSVYDPQAGRVITLEELPRLFVQEQSNGAGHVPAPLPPEKHRKRLFGIL